MNCPSCSHCCCHCDHGSKQQHQQQQPQDTKDVSSHSVTFAKTPGQSSSTFTPATTATSPQLKPVLKNTTENNNNVKKVELRVNNNPNRPRPRSVAVPNPATGSGHVSGLYDGLDDMRLVSLPYRQQEWYIRQNMKYFYQSKDTFFVFSITVLSDDLVTGSWRVWQCIGGQDW